MGNIYATSRRTGKSYLVSVAGDSATPEEAAQIERYVDSVEGFGTPAAPAQEEAGVGNLIDFLQGSASGFARSFADIPGGLASLTAAGLSKIPGDQGEEEIESAGQYLTDAARTGIDYVIGTPNESVMSKSGQALGSLASYITGGAGAIKGVSLLGKGVAAQRLAGTVAAGTLGVAQGAQNQVDRVARLLEEGGEVDNRELAILMGGGIGATEALPLGKAFGTIANMLKKVPKEAKAEAIKTIRGRLKSAGKAGLAEGAQEVTAAIAQDLVEKNLYNPDLDIAASAYTDDAIYGGGAGATFNFLLETVAGRRVKKALKARAELEADQREEGEETVNMLDRARSSLGVTDVDPEPLMLTGPKTEGQALAEAAEEGSASEPTKAQKDFAQNLKNLGLNQDQETFARAQAAKELSMGSQEVDLSDLTEEEASAIRQSRVRGGNQDVDAPASLTEIRSVLGIEVYNREGARQKPHTFEKELTGEEAKLKKQSLDTQSQVAERYDEAKAVIESGVTSNKDGSLSRTKLQRQLKVKPVIAQAIIDKMKKDGVVEPIARNKVKPVKVTEVREPTEQEQAESSANAIIAELEKARQEQVDVLDGVKKAGVKTQQEQLAIEDYERQIQEFDARITAQQNKLESVRSSMPPRPNEPQQANNQALVVQQEAMESQPTDEYKRKLNDVANRLRKYLFGLGLTDVDLVTQNVIDGQAAIEKGQIIEGSESNGEHGRRIISLAMEIYDPNITDAQLEQKLASVLNHEIIHSLKKLGLFSDSEWKMLVKAAEKRKYVKRSGGRNVEREYTFLDRAEVMYKDDPPESQQEEAVAEMFRAYAEGRIKVGGKPKSLFGKMVQFIKRIFNAHSDAGFNNAAELFDNITSGKVGRRQRNIQAASLAPAGAKYSTAGVRAGFLIPERGNVERIQQSFKDVTKRIDAMTEAANKLMNGEIDYQAYDRLVNDVKPIIPYETVPAPATIEEMRNGLKSDQIEKINRLSSIPEGTQVLLRLDIPAYTNNGVWVPTVHGTRETVAFGFKPQEVISHESVSIVNNASLQMTEGQQRGGLRIAAGLETKKPYATIKGSLEYTSPDAAFAEAQAAINDPNYSQVGFDPYRHSYFYDRETTQPIISAERIIQIGPLVLAKNPVFGNKAEHKYSVRRLPSTPENLIGPLPVVHDVKAQYLQSVGMPNRRQGEYVEVNVPLAQRIALAFEEADDRPFDPEVQAAYKAMADETLAQWQFIKETGLEVEFIKPDMSNPYPNGSRDVLIDIRDNNHMWVFPTDSGFGQASITAEDEASNPLLVPAGEIIDGIDMRVNDVFRIVHDYFGHGLEGATFTARGEENAWQSHVRMYGPLAARAMTTETRGQNSWVNYGPFGEQNRENPASTVYADQKLTLLPDFVLNEGVAADLESVNEKQRIDRSRRQSSLTGDVGADGRTVSGSGTGQGNVASQIPKSQETNLGTPKPTVDDKGLTKIVHFSPVSGIETVNPEQQGTNNKMRGAELERRSMFRDDYPARSYFGLNMGEANGYRKEYSTGENVYEALVPAESLYDWDQDPDGFKSKAASMVDDNIMDRTWGKPDKFVVTQAEKMIKDAGYSGYYSNSPMGLVAAMFNETAVEPAGSTEPSPVKQSKRSISVNVPNVNNVNEVRISQKVPSGANAVEDPIENILRLDASDILDNPKLLAKTAEIVRGYNIITEQEAASLGDREVVELLIDRLADNLEFVYENVSPETRERSKLWYVGANRISNEITEKYNRITRRNVPITIEQTSAVLAALSPQKDWYQNVSLGERLVDIFYTKMDISPTPEMEATAQRIFGKAQYKPMLDIIFREGRNMPLSEYDDAPLLQAMFIRIYDETYNDRGYYIVSPDGENIEWARNANGSRSRVAWGSNKEISKAVMALTDPDSISVEMGDRHKVRNFYNNIVAPFSEEGDVTSDTHAVAASHLKPLSGSSTEVHHNFGTSPTANKRDENWNGAVSNSKPLGVKGTYSLYVEAHRLAAQRKNVLPREMQSITWEAVKGLFTPKFKQNKNNIRMIDGIWNEFRAGRKTIDQVRKEILDAAGDQGRFRPPSWEGPSAGSLRGVELAIDPSELSGSVVSRSDPGDDSGIRGTVAGGVKDNLTKYSKRSVGAMPIDMTASAPPVSTADMLRHTDEAYDKITYNNVGRVVGNLASKVFDDRKAQNIQLKAERFMTKFQDSMLPVGKLFDEMRSDGISIPDIMDTYLREELSQGVMGYKLEKNTEDLYEPLRDIIKQIDVSENKINELSSLSKFFESAKDAVDPRMAMADAYLYALHAKERNDYVQEKTGAGLGSGMSEVEANRIIAWVNSLDLNAQDSFRGVKDTVVQIVENTNAVRRDGGLMAAEYRFDNYVPLRGMLQQDDEISEDDEGLPRQASRRRNRHLYGGARNQDPAITSGRGTQYAENIVANVMAQNQRAIVNAERNKVGQSFLKMIQDPNINTEGVGRVVERVAQEDQDNVLNVKVNGQKDPVKVFINDDRIARALKGAGGDGIERGAGILRPLRNFNRYLSNINTTFNPEFAITNFFRDLETAGVNLAQYEEKKATREVVSNAPKAIKGIIAYIRDGERGGEWSSIFEDFMKAGGKNSTNQIDNVADQIKGLKSILDEISDNSIKGKLGLSRNGFIFKLGKFLDDYNTAIENGVRVATYKALLDRGYSKDRAAQAARNVTVNFAKGGEEKMVMNSLFLFYNASLQGSMALMNAAIKSSKVRKIWAGMIVYGILADQINALLSDDEDEDGISDYDELQDFHLEHNLIFPTLGLSDNKFIKIPLGYGINTAFNFGRAMSRAQRGEYTVGEAFNTTFGTLVESLNPLGDNNIENVMVPTVADPFVSLLANKDYKNDPIYKESSQFGIPKPDSQSYWANTSTTAKTISNLFNSATGGSEITPGMVDISPNTIEFWMSYFTGGAGAFVQRIAEGPEKAIDFMRGDFEGDISREIPFVRKLFLSPSTREDVGEFIGQRDRILRAGKELMYARQIGDQAKEASVRKDYANELKVYGQIRALNNFRNQLVRNKNKVKNDPNIPEDQKRALIRRYNEKMEEVVNKAARIVREAGIR